MMKKYRYEASNSSGVPQYGILSADSEADAIERLKVQGLTASARKRMIGPKDKRRAVDQVKMTAFR